MKKLIFNLPTLLVISALLMFSACKKDNASSQDDSVSAEDAAAVSRAVSITSSDGSAAAGQVTSFSGKTESLLNNTLCGATAIDSAGSQITITYGGNQICNGVYRSGSVVITLTGASKWNQQNAVINIAFDTLKVTDVFTSNTYTLNGVYTLTNETSGLAWEVVAELVKNTTVSHRGQTANGITVTFPNGAQGVWTVDKTMSYTSSNGTSDTVTISEYTEAADSIDITGTNRYGTQFTHKINEPIAGNNLHLNSCPWYAYTGETTYIAGSRTATILYGTNSSGQPDGNSTTCPSGFYITYSNGNHTLYKYIAY